MATITRRSRYLAVPVTNRKIYADDTVDFQAAPESIHRAFGRRYTTWADVPDTTPYPVRPGDTLWSLARKFFGSQEYWYVIADFNALDTFYPLALTPNTVLTIPPQSLVSLVRSQI